jgi:hypothetical protein
VLQTSVERASGRLRRLFVAGPSMKALATPSRS